MNLIFCEIRSVLFMGLMVEWKSGTLHLIKLRIEIITALSINSRTLIKLPRYILRTSFRDVNLRRGGLVLRVILAALRLRVNTRYTISINIPDI
jgi:hypothetical protein